MTVIDIIDNVGILIGRPDMVDMFGEMSNAQNETYEDVTLILKIINMVVRELSTTYFPLIAEQKVTFSNGKFAYEGLEKKVVKIIDVQDHLGNKVAYVEGAERIELDSSYSPSSTLTVVYQFVPEAYTEESEIEYKEKDIPARVIAYGVAAEYCISQARFSEAVMHHNRYMLALQELKDIKNKKIKVRSWK